jgi:LiaI-LiaF-like transmembrane region/B-box zinc finger
MNCSTHTDVPAVAFCRSCGRALCADCRRTADGTVYCAEHAPAASGAAAPAYSSAAQPAHTNPRVAFLLGFIPGVGAIYNGQYAKGLVHAVIFGLMISILDSQAIHGLEPLFAILLGVFVLYMPFEAYHTARRRNNGEAVEEFSSLFHSAGGHSTGALALIVVGSIFLLNTLGIVEMRQIMRFWPILLIALGVNMLRSRMSAAERNTAVSDDPNREVNHERQ